MTNNKESLSHLLKIYGEKYGLSIVITDEHGNIVAESLNNNALFQACDHQEFLERIKASSFTNWKVKKPISYDLWPGIYVIFAPVINADGPSYYVWAGLYLEEGSDSLVKEHVDFLRDFDWKNVLTVSPDDKNDLLIAIRHLTELVKVHLDNGNTGNKLEIQSQLFERVFQVDGHLNELLDTFLSIYKEHDFLGIAINREEDEYSITTVCGLKENSLRGVSFSPGEGLLGRVLITETSEFWEQTNKDPRTMLFQRNQIVPKSLFCFPIRQNDGSILLFFGGSLTNERFTKQCKEVTYSLANYLEAANIINYLRKTNKQHVNRLTALTEIGKLLAATPDFKRILYILVDITLNIVEGPFSMIVLKEPGTDIIKLISRGNAEDMEEYAKSIVERYIQTNEWNRSPIVEDNQMNQVIIECPLYYRDRLLGVLCVAASTESHHPMDELVQFLHTLAIIGGVSLQLVIQEGDGDEDKQVMLLFQAVAQFNEQVYEKLKAVEKLAYDFSSKQRFAEPMLKEIVHACRLSYYSPNFIKESIPGSNIAQIVKEGNDLINESGIKWEEASVSGQVYSMVVSYVNNQGKLIENSNHQLVHEFHDFLQETRFKEEEITLPTEELLKEKKMDFIDSPMQKLNLSPREQEVLDLVIQGYNNKEIAEKLYISNHTVKNHVTKIFQKLEVPDRAHAISKVYQLKHQSN